MLDYNMREAINDLKAQYADKFTEVILDFQEEFVNNGFSSAVSTITGGTYSLGKFVWGEVFKLTGVSSKGSALKTFYGLYCYNGALDREFDNAFLAAKDNADNDYTKALIGLQKATKKVAVNSILATANWWQKDKETQAADEQKNRLDSWTYYVWEKYVTANDEHGTGGGGSGAR